MPQKRKLNKRPGDLFRCQNIDTRAREPQQQLDNSQVREGPTGGEAVSDHRLEPTDWASQVSAFLQVCVTIIENLRGPLVEGPSLLSRHTDSSVNGGARPI